MQKAYLVLANEYIFEGYSFGAPITSIGELVFTTGMGGYIETLTDPSYNGQIVMQTFPLIGNYGIIEDDFEGECAIKGYVVRYPCATPSNFRTDYTLDEFLKKRNIPGLYGIDTREVTRIIREYGVVNAMITTELPTDFTPIKNYAIVDAVKQVSTKESFTVTAENEQYKVALLDYGAKRNIIRELVKRGCSVTVLPYDTKAEDILALNPDGLMLSNGPGDPAENVVPIAELAKLSGQTADLRHLLRSSAVSLSARRRNCQTKIRPPRCQPAGERSKRHPHLHHQPKPRLRGRFRELKKR